MATKMKPGTLQCTLIVTNGQIQTQIISMDINAGILCMMLVSDMSALFLNNILNSFKGNIGNCYPLEKP